MTRNRAILAVLLACLAGPALAQQQLEITADQFVLDEQSREATFTGNVVINHPTVTLWAPQVVLVYGEGGTSDIRSFVATAKESLTVRLKTKDQDATGDKAVFDPSSQVLALTGDVVVVNSAGTMTGPSLIVDLEKNTSVFTGRDQKRVTGVFNTP